MTKPIEWLEAIALAKEGFAVFPCHKSVNPGGYLLCTCGEVGCKGKHPDGRFSEMATTNPDKINQYGERWGGRTIGIHCGKSHVWVLDVDGEQGKQELKYITDKYGEIPPTRTVKTGGDGIHFIFAAWVDRIRSGKLIADTPAGKTDKLDIKGNVGHAYVIAPPSLHYKMSRYEYINRVPPVDAPEWLIKLVMEKTDRETNGATTSLSNEQLESRHKYEIPIWKILDSSEMSKLHKEGSTIRGSHPVHGSTTNRNFCIDMVYNRWFCNRCCSSGGLFELAAILGGICSCDDFKRNTDDEITIPSLQGKKFIQAVQVCLDRGISADDLKRHISKGCYNAR